MIKHMGWSSNSAAEFAVRIGHMEDIETDKEFWNQLDRTRREVASSLAVTPSERKMLKSDLKKIAHVRIDERFKGY